MSINKKISKYEKKITIMHKNEQNQDEKTSKLLNQQKFPKGGLTTTFFGVFVTVYDDSAEKTLHYKF